MSEKKQFIRTERNLIFRWLFHDEIYYAKRHFYGWKDKSAFHEQHIKESNNLLELLKDKDLVRIKINGEYHVKEVIDNDIDDLYIDGVGWLRECYMDIDEVYSLNENGGYDIIGKYLEDECRWEAM